MALSLLRAPALRGALALALVAACAASTAAASNSINSYAGWLGFGGGSQTSSHARATLGTYSGVLWKFQTPSAQPSVSAGPLVAPDSSATYICDRSGVVYALAIPAETPSGFTAAFKGDATPHVLWTYTTGGPIENTPALTADGSVLYVASQDQMIHGINTKDGSRVFHIQLNTPLSSAPVLAEEAGVLFVGDDSGTFYAVNISATGTGSHDGVGTQKWVCLTQKYVTGGSALSTDGSSIYFGSGDNWVYRAPVVQDGANAAHCAYTRGAAAKCYYDSSSPFAPPPSGAPCATWQVNPSGTPVTSPPALDAEAQLLYVSTVEAGGGTFAGGLFAVDLSGPKANCTRSMTGCCPDNSACGATQPPLVRQLHMANGSGATTGPTVVSKGVVAYAGSDSTVYLIDALKGTTKWSQAYADEKGISSTPVSDGTTLAFGASDGFFYIVDVANGDVLERFHLEEEQGVVAQAAIDGQGRYVVATMGGKVWLVGADMANVLLIRVGLGVAGVALIAIFCCCCVRRARARSAAAGAYGPLDGAKDDRFGLYEPPQA